LRKERHRIIVCFIYFCFILFFAGCVHISNAKAALDQTLLHANKIRAVINGLCNRLILFYLTPFLCFVFLATREKPTLDSIVEYLRVPVDDQPSSDLYAYFERTYEFIGTDPNILFILFYSILFYS